MSRKNAETHDWRVDPDPEKPGVVRCAWCGQGARVSGLPLVQQRCLGNRIIATWKPYRVPWLKDA